MAVPVVNLTLEKGTNFEATFNVFEADSDAVNFSNFSGVCKIRKYPSSPNFQSCSVTITGATGTVKVAMAKTTTTLLQSGRNYYDVVLTSAIDQTSFKVVEGNILVSETSSL
jgi:hypothetical protein